MQSTSPRNWPLAPTRYVFSILNGSTPSSSEPSYWDGDIWWATPEDIGSLNGRYLSQTKRRITEAGYKNSGTKIAPAGSIVLTTRAPVGNLAIARVPVCTNQGCKTLVKIKESTDERYFYYQYLGLKDRLQAVATGTTFVELGRDQLSSFPLLIPPENEQRAIADYLDHETARIDALIDVKQRLLSLLSDKRLATLSQAVLQGINSDVNMKNTDIDWLGKIPKNWDVIKIGYLFRERDERNRPDLPLLNVSIHTGVTIRELSEKHVEQMAEDFSVYKVAYQGDISFNKMRMWQGAVGVAPITGLVSPDYVVAQPVAPINVEYYGLLFRTPAFSAEAARYSHGIVWDRLRLYWEEFRDMWVPVPPTEDQQAIVSYIQNETVKIDELASVTQKSIDLLKEHRSALIAALVTGQIPVSEASCS